MLLGSDGRPGLPARARAARRAGAGTDTRRRQSRAAGVPMVAGRSPMVRRPVEGQRGLAVWGLGLSRAIGERSDRLASLALVGVSCADIGHGLAMGCPTVRWPDGLEQRALGLSEWSDGPKRSRCVRWARWRTSGTGLLGHGLARAWALGHGLARAWAPMVEGGESRGEQPGHGSARHTRTGTPYRHTAPGTPYRHTRTGTPYRTYPYRHPAPVRLVRSAGLACARAFPASAMGKWLKLGSIVVSAT